MKKILLFSTACLMAASAMAQETYESAQLSTQDLNGTAKYIGMGGAMEALGGDISTINTNPAGVAMFRKSWVGVSGGFTAQSGSQDGLSVAPLDKTFGKTNKTNADLNQLGMVYCIGGKNDSWINLAVNYQKSRNFNQIMPAINYLYDSSASKVNYMKYYGGMPSYSMQDELIESVISTPLGGDADNLYYRAADNYFTKYDNSGYISNFDFSVSGSINNKVYLGLTVGVKDVHYDSENSYMESLLDADDNYGGTFAFNERRKITGNGFDIKLGAIFRLIDNSPFRFGFYINSPTWYDLECEGNMFAAAELDYDGKSYTYKNNHNSAAYRYKYEISTPWRFGASVGHTFGKVVALGATYEYADYSYIKNRIVEGTYYDDHGYEHNETSIDHQMDKNTEASLNGVSLLKLGVEIKPTDFFAIRLGYNYQSAIYDKDNGYKDPSIDNDTKRGSVGAYYSTYDYVNWDSTNRFTCGLGFKLGSCCNLDISYQYATQKGEYHPFTNIKNTYSEDSEEYCDAAATTVKNNRHQLNMTLGFRF